MNSKKQNHRKLEKKLTLQIAFMILGAAGGVLIAFMIFSNRFGNLVVDTLETFFDMDYYQASSIYQNLFRNNMTFILLAVFLLFFVILYRLSLRWMMRYFDEIEQGIDALTIDDAEIRLSEELDFMQYRLTSVKKTLMSQKRQTLEAEQRKNDLVVYLAHDIKTPLTTIVGYLNLLEQQPNMTIEDRAKYTNIMLDKAQRLETLLDEFFDITRFNAQNIDVRKETIDLQLFFAQVEDEFYPMLQENKKKIVLNIAGKPSVQADPNLLVRVMRNLVKNAISYGEAQSTITISVVEKNGYIQIIISNRGITLTPEDAEKIFSKFFRLDEARRTNTGGAGLGLAISRMLVEAHNGSLTARSHNGKTDFITELPATKTDKP